MAEAPATRRLGRADERRGSGLLLLLLGVMALCSAVAVVQVKHRTRSATAELESLRQEQDRLDVEWAQLQLEEAAHSSHARIESIAREQLKMLEPRETVMAGAAP